MTLQDDLLSFQIRETIFLSSDKASIAELRELELLPDVEIIENPSEISITGCLYLQGKYTPTREARDKREGGTDTLVSALHFSPFQLEENQTSEFFYEPEVDLTHRIPLNVSIPANRVKELGDIYAIVDGFDYQLASANQLQIQADLKIAGISLHSEASDQIELEDEDELDDQAEKDKYHEQDQAEWEFVHVAEDQDESDFQPVSLDEIERKLAALEQEIETQQGRSSEEYVSSYFHKDSSQYRYAQQEEEIEPVTYEDEQNELPSTYGDITYARDQYDEPSGFTMVAIEESDTGSEEDEVEAIPADAGEEDTEWEVETVSGDEETEEANEAAEVEEVEEVDSVIEPEVVSGNIEAEEMSVEVGAEVEASEPAADAKEMKVAISGKPAKEPEGAVNLTNIFSQAKRAQDKSVAVEQESSSASDSSRRSGYELNSSTLEAVSNLTSVVRSHEEQFSKMKICIIQKNETIESIASRYSLPVSRILDVNNMSSDRIAEGQILYIPQ